MDEKFNMFMETVDERFRSFVNQINGYLTENGCKCDIKLQKCGYVVSYVLNSWMKAPLPGDAFIILPESILRTCPAVSGFLLFPPPESEQRKADSSKTLSLLLLSLRFRKHLR